MTSRAHRQTIAVPGAPPIREHDVVRALHRVEADGVCVEQGEAGTVVHVYPGGSAFVVEFGEEAPPRILTVGADSIGTVA